jgi:hypothetical protein
MGEKHHVGVHEYWGGQSHTIHQVEVADLNELRQALSKYGPKLFWTQKGARKVPGLSSWMDIDRLRRASLLGNVEQIGDEFVPGFAIWSPGDQL